ncbi:MAG: hypothetical protein A6D91_03180 [Bacillaceae bacterium G1]|nr:MAG: hypothetical protein A6D91_03180 [Bacillaceae bacterium G1]
MKERIWTGVIGGTFFVAVLALGGIWYALLLMALAVFAFDEWTRLRRIPRWNVLYILGIFFLLSFFVKVDGSRLDSPAFFALFVWGLLALPVLTKNRINVEDIAHVLLGVAYLGFGFSAFLLTRGLEEGLLISLWLLFATWANDTMAFFIGRQWGHKKLWPAISPNKTVAGALAGVLAAVLVSIVFSPYLSASWLKMAALGLLIGLAGQLGDLMESAVKRSFHVKDAGWIFPGHGGVLDRFDSLLVVFPVIFYLFLS